MWGGVSAFAFLHGSDLGDTVRLIRSFEVSPLRGRTKSTGYSCGELQ